MVCVPSVQCSVLMDCIRPPCMRLSQVTVTTVAIAICLIAPTLAQYHGYYRYNFNSLPYPYPYAGTYYRPFIVPQTPSEQATPTYLPPDGYRGFAYQTAYANGGGANVVFVRGQDAHVLLHESIRTNVLTPSITVSSNVLKLADKNATQSGEKNPTTEQKNTTEPEAKVEEKTQHSSSSNETKVPTSTVATVILPPLQNDPRCNLPPPVATFAPGAFFYPLPVTPLAPPISYFNPPTDFFGQLGLPPLFSTFDITAGNGEIPGFVFDPSVPRSAPSVPSSSDDETSRDFPSDNGATTDEENSSSSEEVGTESSLSDTSSSSSSSSESSETSNSSETASTSDAKSNSKTTKDAGQSSNDVSASNSDASNGASNDSSKDSTEVPNKRASKPK